MGDGIRSANRFTSTVTSLLQWQLKVGAARIVRCRDEPAAGQGPFLQVHHMAVRIRLRRTGRKNAATYRIVVVDGRKPREGQYLETIGQYAPRGGDQALNLVTDRANYWLDKGAQPSDTVRSLLRRGGVFKARHEARLAKKLSGAAVPVSEA